MLILSLFFHFIFYPKFLTIRLTILKLYKAVDNIHLEGTVSQNCNIGPSFIFMSENRKTFIIFFTIIFIDFKK